MGIGKCVLFCLWAMLLGAGSAFAQDIATSPEVMEKVREAAAVLAKKQGSVPREFQKAESDWVWKNTYVFVFDCENFTMQANPAHPDLVGKSQISLVDKQGNHFFIGFCDAMEEHPQGSWVEYWWPEKKGENPNHKISFVMQVPGTKLGVGAGIYTHEETAIDLNADLQ